MRKTNTLSRLSLLCLRRDINSAANRITKSELRSDPLIEACLCNIESAGKLCMILARRGSSFGAVDDELLQEALNSAKAAVFTVKFALVESRTQRGGFQEVGSRRGV